MPGIVEEKAGKLYRYYAGTTTTVEPWGQDSLRVREVVGGDFIDEDFALTEKVKNQTPVIKTWTETQEVVSNMPGLKTVTAQCGSITHGKITATFQANGKLVFTNSEGKVLLEEFARNRLDGASKDLSALEIEGREFKPHLGGDFKVTARFEANKNEKIYGMGIYQQPYLNLKGCTLELAQRNSQASVPFYISTNGYGFLWNNPAIGEVNFSNNLTKWTAYSTKKLDYWITASDRISQIEERYTEVTGRVPMMPEYAMGFWQSKLRYVTQDQVLEVAREYKKRKLPLDVIVIDFFHWKKQGDWSFDNDYFPNPKAMIDELKDMGIETVVSVWPTVEKESVNYKEMNDKGYLIRTDRGVQTTMEFLVPTVPFDATNPEARKFVFDKCKENYCSLGIKNFWLDVAEPECAVYDFDNMRYYKGSNLQIGNIYPAMYAKTFYDGLKSTGVNDVISLIRCAWAGSQKYGALVWSGDVGTTFKDLKNQITAGLNMSLAGLSWFTTDIGGFHGGDPENEDYREVFARWFEYGCFCPVMRVHGDRHPRQPMVGLTGGGMCCSGGHNEVYSYGDRVYKICRHYLDLRVKLKPYIKEIMKEAHKKGTPVMRPVFYDFQDDQKTFEVEDCYMFGPSLLVCPIYEKGKTSREVYLPKGATWRDTNTGSVYEGGITITVDAPLEYIPVFARDNFDLI